MASGFPRRPTLKEAGFCRQDWNAGPVCPSRRSLGLRVCVSGSTKGTCAWNVPRSRAHCYCGVCGCVTPGWSARARGSPAPAGLALAKKIWVFGKAGKILTLEHPRERNDFLRFYILSAPALPLSGCNFGQMS